MRTSISILSLLFTIACASTDEKRDVREQSASTAFARLPFMTVELSAGSPGPDITVGSTTEEEVSIFDIYSSSEGLTLTDFHLFVGGDIEPVDAVWIYYEDEDGDVITSSGTPDSEGLVQFEDETVMIPDSGEGYSRLYTNVDTATHITATSGQQYSIDWINFGASAIGVDSGREIGARAMTSRARGGLMTWHETEPALTRHSTSPLGSISGEGGTLIKWNVSADAHGEVTYNDQLFEISSDDTSGTGWNTCNELGQTAKWTIDMIYYEFEDVAWRFFDTDGRPCDLRPDNELGYVLATDINNLIEEGETTTFSISASNLCDYCDGDPLMVTLPSESEVDDVNPRLQSINWSDDDDGETSWDGSLIDDLPVEGGALYLE